MFRENFPNVACISINRDLSSAPDVANAFHKPGLAGKNNGIRK